MENNKEQQTELVEEPKGEKKKIGKVKFIIMLIALLLLTGGGICFYTITHPCWNRKIYYTLSSILITLHLRYPEDFVNWRETCRDPLGIIYKLGDFTSNLLGEGRHYIKISIVIEFAYEKDVYELSETEQAKVIEEIKHDIEPIDPILKHTIYETLSILLKSTPDEITGENSSKFLKKHCVMHLMIS